MVIAVVAMRMVQVAVDQIVDVIAVRDWFVPAARPVDMVLGVAIAGMGGSAIGRIGAVDRKNMLFDAGWRHMVQVAIVQIVGVAIMLDALVSTTRTMIVVMVWMSMCHLV